MCSTGTTSPSRNPHVELNGCASSPLSASVSMALEMYSGSSVSTAPADISNEGSRHLDNSGSYDLYKPEIDILSDTYANHRSAPTIRGVCGQACHNHSPISRPAWYSIARCARISLRPVSLTGRSVSTIAYGSTTSHNHPLWPTPGVSNPNESARVAENIHRLPRTPPHLRHCRMRGFVCYDLQGPASIRAVKAFFPALGTNV
ncbi:hypothetical protein C8Q77DRAFT_166102 [Trametes polyzona]|nr:hypothetical protein C8Q77DRAFT_166102 [Trametes polyzona]